MKEFKRSNILSQPIFWLILFLFTHLLIWTLLPAFLLANPPIDTMEGVAWGNLWQFGYDKHPFLAAWLTAFFTNFFHNVTWPIYLLGQLSVIICFWGVWRIALKIVSPWHALLSVISLEGIWFYTIQSCNFNPDVLMLPTWALTSLAFYNAVNTQKVIHWLWVGIFAGLAMITKYESAILLFLLGILLFITPEGKRSFKYSGIYFAALFTILIVMTNFYWLWQHHFVAFTYAIGRMQLDDAANENYFWMRFYEPFKFLMAQITTLVPGILVCLPFSGTTENAAPLGSFNKKFLLILGIGPLVFTLLFSVITGSHLLMLWAFPFFSLSTLAIIAWTNPVITQKSLQVFLRSFLILFIGTILVGIFLFTHTEYFPGRSISKFATETWHQYYQTPLPYVGGERVLVANVNSFSHDKPIPYFNVDLNRNPWVDERQVNKQGAVFMYRLDHESFDIYPIIWTKLLYPNLQHEMIKFFKYQTKKNIPPLIVWIAFLPPKN